MWSSRGMKRANWTWSSSNQCWATTRIRPPSRTRVNMRTLIDPTKNSRWPRALSPTTAWQSLISITRVVWGTRVITSRRMPACPTMTITTSGHLTPLSQRTQLKLIASVCRILSAIPSLIIIAWHWAWRVRRLRRWSQVNGGIDRRSCTMRTGWTSRGERLMISCGSRKSDSIRT